MRGTAWERCGRQRLRAVGDGGGNLYVEVDVITCVASPVNSIAKWETGRGAAWERLGTGVKSIVMRGMGCTAVVSYAGLGCHLRGFVTQPYQVGREPMEHSKFGDGRPCLCTGVLFPGLFVGGI